MPDKAPAFHAAPVPQTLYQPSKLPLIPEARPTQQEAFQLQSEARHQQVLQAPPGHVRLQDNAQTL